MSGRAPVTHGRNIAGVKPIGYGAIRRMVFSDGVSEALHPQGEEFEDARILETLTETTAGNAQERLQALFASGRAFTAGAPQSDNVTVLVVCYLGATG